MLLLVGTTQLDPAKEFGIVSLCDMHSFTEQNSLLLMQCTQQAQAKQLVANAMHSKGTSKATCCRCNALQRHKLQLQHLLLLLLPQVVLSLNVGSMLSIGSSFGFRFRSNPFCFFYSCLHCWVQLLHTNDKYQPYQM